MHAPSTNDFPAAHGMPSLSPSDPEQFLRFSTTPSLSSSAIINGVSPFNSCTTFGRVYTPMPTPIANGSYKPWPHDLLAPTPAAVYQLFPDGSARDYSCDACIPGRTFDKEDGRGDAADDTSGYVAGSPPDKCGTSSSSSIKSQGWHSGSNLVRRQRQRERLTVQRSIWPLQEGGVTHAGTLGSDDESVSGLNTRADKDIRRQQVQSEQRRRDNLRTGFARLKEVLPTSHQKCSKLVLLERAASYISHLEARLHEDRNTDGAFGLMPTVAEWDDVVCS